MKSRYFLLDAKFLARGLLTAAMVAALASPAIAAEVSWSIITS